MNPSQHGFFRINGVIPELKLGKPKKNVEALIQLFEVQKNLGAQLVVAPELCLTGYTCEDWFHSEQLMEETEIAMQQLVQYTRTSDCTYVVGAPYRLPDSRLLNAAWIIQKGKVKGVVPKLFLPNTGEFYERRWFVSGRRVHEEVHHPLYGNFWVSPKQIFTIGSLQFGVEICQDLWSPSQPSNFLALSGAHIILNLSASNELVSKSSYRKKMIEVQSQRLLCGYFYISSGVAESSKDTVFGAHTLAYELGEELGELAPFQDRMKQLVIDFDIDRIKNARTKEICFLEAVDEESRSKVIFNKLDATNASSEDSLLEQHALFRNVTHQPFIDEIDNAAVAIEIQAQGLYRRLTASRSKSMILGVSGGLDSTLALRVCERARELSGNQIKLIGVTMPGPGTSETTLSIARKLLDLVKVDKSLEIKIQDSVDQHLRDIGKDLNDRSVVYENAQARERTQILFDLANEHHGIVVGTGDLSELALGWCTYNADHMSHYTVNSGVPKTVVKFLVHDWAFAIRTKNPELSQILTDIVYLPISPELLPPAEDGSIAQHTEKVLGSYELHDFFLYHVLKHGASPRKIKILAQKAFENHPEFYVQIERTLEIFYSRFFSQQFKRSTLPPGPKVHSVGLSPRSDFRLPDEMSV